MGNVHANSLGLGHTRVLDQNSLLSLRCSSILLAHAHLEHAVEEEGYEQDDENDDANDESGSCAGILLVRVVGVSVLGKD